MNTRTIKSQVNAIWEHFWSNGVSNPLTFIEQMSYSFFMRALDDVRTAREPVFGLGDEELQCSGLWRLDELINLVSRLSSSRGLRASGVGR